MANITGYRWRVFSDTAANLTSSNPTLLAGELAKESDTGKVKIGDGSTAWTSLSYINGGGGSTSASTTGSITIPIYYDVYRIKIDTTAGDVALTVGDGQFDGQQILLKETGGGNKARIIGNGFYAGADSGGMYLVGRSIICTWNDDDSLWEMDDCVTAEWVDSGTTVITKANGGIKMKIATTLAYAAAGQLVFVWNFPVTFDGVPHVFHMLNGLNRSLTPGMVDLGLTDIYNLVSTSVSLFQRRVTGLTDFGTSDTAGSSATAEGTY